MITATINCATSFLAGFVVFSVLGYMSVKLNKAVDEVATDGETAILNFKHIILLLLII